MKVVNEVEMMEVDLYLFISLALPPRLIGFIVPYLFAEMSVLQVGYNDSAPYWLLL